jgi:hypothetical protein
MTMTSDEIEFDLMLFRCNTLTYLDDKKLAMALASTDESDLLLFDSMAGIKANGIKEEWVLRIYNHFLDIENERRQLASEPCLTDFPIVPETLECLVLFLGQRYGINTIKHNILPKLNQLQADNCSQKFTEEHQIKNEAFVNQSK